MKDTTKTTQRQKRTKPRLKTKDKTKTGRRQNRTKTKAK
jgi:hypothetical protein